MWWVKSSLGGAVDKRYSLGIAIHASRILYPTTSEFSMARLRVFVSSTCYDLDVLRSELRPFIAGMGYEPVMSDYSDVLYDPRSHTHDSCLKEVPGCDMVILIIGSRFGGLAVPGAFAQLDFAALEKLSTRPGLLETRECLSITQLEVLKAVEQSIPVYAFIDDKVMHDHHVYERNKDKADIIDQIEFPSIQKRETAKYIFEFINFLTHRVTNNSITSFTRLEEIRLHLLGKWSQLLQRLLTQLPHPPPRERIFGCCCARATRDLLSAWTDQTVADGCDFAR